MNKKGMLKHLYIFPLKVKFYRTAVRPTMLYEIECWTIKNSHEHKVSVSEMIMLRLMCGKTR